MALLQKQLGDSQDRQKHAKGASISLEVEVAQLRGKLATQTQDLALQVRHNNAGTYPDNPCSGDKMIVQLAPQRAVQRTVSLDAVGRLLTSSPGAGESSDSRE